MKILFIENKLRTDKLGILYISRIMKDAGHSVDLIQASIENVDDYMHTNKPDFVLYSVMSGEHEWFIDYNKYLKSKFDFTSIMGGPHFTFFPEQRDIFMDYVVQGPGETVILDILDGNIKPGLVVGHLPDVESLPHPDRSILYKYDEFGNARMKRFIAGRYCLFSCKYCFNHLFKRLYKDEKSMFFQRLSPFKMVDEINNVRKNYRLELVYFNDDDLASSKDWILEFCDLYKKEVGLEYCGSIRASSVDYETLKTMRDAGCVFLNIALESANPETQKFLRRGFITNEQIRDACAYCKELGIKVRLQNMIGLPVEDPLKDALDTLKMNQEINPTDSWASIFQPFPKTDLWHFCLDKGLITPETQSRAFYEHSPLKIKDVEKINRLHKWWFFAVLYQLPIELVEILLDIEITEEQEQRFQEFRWDVAKKLLYGM